MNDAQRPIETASAAWVMSRARRRFRTCKPNFCFMASPKNSGFKMKKPTNKQQKANDEHPFFLSAAFVSYHFWELPP
jgi:hypothetical protein